MRKKYSLSFILAFLLIFNMMPIHVFAESEVAPTPNNSESIVVDARSALLIEPITGKVLYEKNSKEKFAPASVTKVMTMLLTMEAVDSGKINLQDKVTVSENAKRMGGSTMLLDIGEVRTVEELLKGVAIASGNDAAVALAELLGGTEENFVGLMNKRAKELGMNDTTFKNCNGLPIEGHETTAYDIAIMSKELLKHPKILEYSGTYMETISEGRKSPIELVNQNKLVRFFDGCDGLKTGFTNEAKYCISATSMRNGVRVLAVIMGAPTYKVRNRDAGMLMNYGLAKFENKEILKKDTEVEKVVFNKKGDKFFTAMASTDFSIPVEKGSEANIDKKIKIDKSKTSYVKGEKIGQCEISLNGEVIGTVDLYCDRDLKVGGFLQNLKSNFTNLFDHAV
ncbi:D-alanyl-D-alanine carboxypeptidase (penicillin-binding protein 5/6) [Clostridium collagenovorans DSM 3089]|uniref:serine-type D-Ala-D-Ala carboxypeptidase n=1 Tax=Clostridium collagenovorans DSM 3089 TaxID=1121306 RepID=A0A1M5T678_9CLOT|nr:D-alanyl-D-alanine carboxypeptidase family protein [Clostridium collagenovorans]SHH46188.1 D-alanyl-D-alanine carboxypeptidase (penicillin-binding protein 5/6) [Clostridium collagenovorans DSM 3089]